MHGDPDSGQVIDFGGGFWWFSKQILVGQVVYIASQQVGTPKQSRVSVRSLAVVSVPSILGHSLPKFKGPVHVRVSLMVPHASTPKAGQPIHLSFGSGLWDHLSSTAFVDEVHEIQFPV